MIACERLFLAAGVLATAVTLTGCDSKRRELLCEADFDAVLQASRELVARMDSGELKPGRYDFRSGSRSPEVSQFPKVLVDLAPNVIYLEQDGYADIRLGGGFDNFGLKAYPEEFKAPFPGFIWGDRKLIDGLWYCDDGYRETSGYDKKVEGWLSQRKKRR